MNVEHPAEVVIDGAAFSPDLYAGRAPALPGADEIVMTLPPNVSTGCLLSLQISVNGQLSNSTTISIAAGSDNACTAPGITTAQLARLDQGGNFSVGVMTLSGSVDTRTSAQGVTSSTRQDEASATFLSLNADQLNAGVPGASTTVAITTASSPSILRRASARALVISAPRSARCRRR